MLQGYEKSIRFNAPAGLGNVQGDNTSSARYLENMLVSDNNTCSLRYGTKLVAQFPFNADRIFTDQVSIMSHLGDNGKSEKIVYQNYLTVLPIVSVTDDVTLEAVIGQNGWSRIIIDTSLLNMIQKSELVSKIYDGVYFYVKQDSISQGADISNTVIDLDNNIVSFDLSLAYDFFDRNYEVDPVEGSNSFELWFERGALYKLTDNGFENAPLLDDLDPNVIISHINYQGKLVIANGVNPVQVYDGTEVTSLKGEALLSVVGAISHAGDGNDRVRIDDQIVLAAQVLTFAITESSLSEMQTYVTPGSQLILISLSNQLTANKVASVTYDTTTSRIEVILVLASTPPGGIQGILYYKDLPAFSYITVVHDRLFALAAGRSYLNQFRSASLASKVYYANERKSINRWFNQTTKELPYIDLSVNSNICDNLETIIPFQNKVLFFGRETTQIWAGEDPTTLDSGQNLAFPDFKWEMNLPVGILQKSLYMEIPNNLVFLSKYGISAIRTTGEHQQLVVSYDFAKCINQAITRQVSAIATERDYRLVRAFSYPCGALLGFRTQGNCFVYQMLTNTWTLFTKNFIEATNFYYDSVSQDLLISKSGGRLLAYADKQGNSSYEEYGYEELPWCIKYQWLDQDFTWSNEAALVALRTIPPVEIKLEIFIDYDNKNSFKETIKIEQGEDGQEQATDLGAGVLLHLHSKAMSFKAKAIMVSLSGQASSHLVFDKLFLVGGKNSSQLNPLNTDFSSLFNDEWDEWNTLSIQI
jgi:hypothetical protein